MDPETMVMPLILIVLFFPFCTSVDTLTPDQSIKDGQSLISNKNNFALGFFSPGNSSYRYLGIWFVKVPNLTIVWVANRNDPIIDSSGVLSINNHGNLVLHDSSNRLLWSTNVSVQGTTSVAQLQDSGNLVLVQGNNKKVIWQSFDHPTDTLLPGMRLGLNRMTGLDRFLTSWKSQDDPGTGDYIYKMNPTGSPQLVLYKGSTLYWRSGPWPWHTSSSAATASSGFKYYSVNNEDELSYTYFFDDPSIISRLVVDISGLLQHLMWNDGDLQWKEFWSTPKYRCDNYRHCGAYGKCGPESADSFNRFECTCLPGYEPKSPKNWYHRDGSEGCVRKQLGLSMCGNGEGFVKVELLKGPDSFNAVWMDMSMSSSECEQACLRNCSCTAFLSINIDGKGTSCLAWYGELIDISESSYEMWDLNVRVDATELAAYTRKSNGFLGHKRKLAITIISVMVTLFLVCLIGYVCLMKKRKTSLSKKKKDEENKRTVKRKLHHQSLYFNGTMGYLEGNELEESRHPDLFIFDLSCIVAATDNFSPINKLGQGGFGSVFKGQLSNGQQVAVKRLSNSSGQGIDEFKNEVMLIAKLQHRNLVKLFGCCIQGEEKMLIYEYMPNKSLDFFIFDHTRSSLLNWGKRFEIIIGITRGILYLHQDSRLRIIHRDLKTSNVLLDGEMNPKISDFGIARIFNGDQFQDKTTRIIGTYGYMSPEYAIFGKFSTKSDVFSFGVILLEIISGKKNNSSYQTHPSLTLIGHVWELWRQDRALDIVDSSITESFVSHEVLRCIQIGLLCVQEDATDRPTMLAILLMLSCETTLPSPKQPAFVFIRPTNDLGSVKGEGFYSINDVTITMFEAR
ncbi:G-type lectin S-receptor-like serine/threonine-protein kinase RKS1 isoform X1 [Quercus robur]|uniref:G-type lectin S-receptor-like serine/threonine-protein kinase RKS1 isoform X1 n=1 Tax=Quercus robur TaxID=38942 RepID=UPI0021633579|nr:G-type lectin S-receptor-like serine/threonine-protein kinase RKS1 isoform X1 [Quercus robur]XP_050288862.1 G-type lectin S-receptor-like serine/threonine-protein kinase RKS1 isoform X1 [Quercus robur]XP_050288864.1 G-type lectin S-receptor-like serine/threonine-protein kinase RKS1 isoform X1 [Quercus robur]